MTATLSPILDERGRPFTRANQRTPADRQRAARDPRLAARYDAAQTTDENSRHWAQADYLGPESALDPRIRRIVRSRARYEVANNTYAAGMVKTLANDMIGTGAGVQFLSGNRQDDLQAEAAFWSWCLATRLPRKMHTMRGGKAVDGETFASFFTNRALRNPVKLDLQPHEPEMIANPVLGLGLLSTASLLSDGIIFDDFGNVAAYMLLKEHPGDRVTTTGVQFETVRADDMIHLFNCERAGQVRGMSEIAASLPLYAQLRRYTLAVIRCAESAAIPSWVLKTQQNPNIDVDDSPEAMDTLDTERGMGLTLPQGWDLGQLRAEQPTSTYSEFKRCLVAEIARVLNMPYNVAAGDSSSYNYSSGRLDHKVYGKAQRVERSYWEIDFLDRCLVRWWEEARLVDGVLPDRMRRLEQPADHLWRWDGDEHVDPTKEASATETRLRIGMSSWADECSKQGVDVETIHQQNADALGLTLEEYRARLAGYMFSDAAAVASQQRQQLVDGPGGDNGDVTKPGDNGNRPGNSRGPGGQKGNGSNAD